MAGAHLKRHLAVFVVHSGELAIVQVFGDIDRHATEGVDDVDKSGKIGEYGVINGYTDELTDGLGGKLYTATQGWVDVAIDMGGIDARGAVARNRYD